MLGRLKALFGSPPPAAPAAVTAKPDASEATTDAADQARRDGNTALREGRNAEALAHYERFATLQPGSAAAHVNRAFALFRLGRLTQSEAAYRQALELDPADAETVFFLGRCLAAQERVADAAAQYRQAVALQPRFTQARLALAEAQESLGDLAAAAATLRRLGADEPDVAPAWAAAARIALQRRDGPEALASCERWIALDTAAAQAHGMHADALRLVKRPHDALAAAERAVALDPHDPRVRQALGDALLALRRHAEAADVFTQVLGTPSLADAQCAELLQRRGGARFEQSRLDEAIEDLESALRLRSGDAQVEFVLSVALLKRAHGSLDPASPDWARGWALYDSRVRAALGPNAEVSTVGPPRWAPGADLAGRTVLLESEQGLGDALHFLRYVPLVLARGVRVLLRLSPRVAPLLPAPWPGCRIVTESANEVADLCCPLPSLPHVLGIGPPLLMQAPYVSARTARREHWRRRLDAGARCRVGLAWAGNPDHPDDARRSMPLEPLRATLQGLSDVQFVSLQLALPQRDEAAAAAWPSLLQPCAEQTDLADTAALVEVLDLVVSVDTSLAHLGGALGRPLRLLLSFACDWRWGAKGEESPWYPSARLFRQSVVDDWTPVLQRLHAELATWPARSPD